MATSTERIVYDIVAHDRNAKKTFDDTAKSVDKAGKSFEHLGGDARSLDERISQTKGHLHGLIAEFENTNDKTLFRDIRKDRSTISLLEAMRKEIAGVGDDSDDAGKKVRKSFVSSLTDGLKDLASSHPVVVAAVGIGAAVAPFVGAAISGAVLGGVGLGGIIGGIALAAHDSRVQEAGKQLGRNLMGGLHSAAEPFIAPILDSINILESAGEDLTGHLSKGFRALAPLVKPLTEGVAGLVHNLGPGLDRAFVAAEPAIRALANELPQLGAAASDFLSSLSDESGNATEGLIGLLDSVEFVTKATGEWLGELAWLYGGLVKAGNAIHDLRDESALWGQLMATSVGPLVHLFADEADSSTTAAQKAADSTSDWSGSLLHLASAEEDAATQAKALKDAFDKLFGIQMSLDEANIRYQEAIDKTLKTLKDGKRTLDINTQAGRDNKQAALDQIQAIDDLRTANINNGMSIDTANGKYNTQLDSLRKTLLSLGFNKTAVDNLIGSYKKIPPKAETQVKAPGLNSAYQTLLDYVTLLGVAEGAAKFEFSQYRAGERNPSGRASGGPVASGVSYIVGENGPELITMGGNGYVHNASQTASMLSGASGGALAVNVNVNPSGGADEFKNMILKWLRVDAGFRATVKAYVGAGS